MDRNLLMNIYKFALVSALLVMNLGLIGCQKADTASQEIVPFVMVTQPESSHHELKSYAGDVQARQQTALAFRVPGQITERYVDVGDRVQVGQVLARLDVKDAQLQLNAAQAQLDNAKSAFKIAQDEIQRFKQLLPSHAVSRSQYDAVDNQYKAAQANLKQAQANFDVAKNQTQYNQLIANKNGVITARNIEVGQVVAAGQAAFQMAIGAEREAVIGIPEQAIQGIQVGQQAWVSLWSHPEQKIAATVREISPAADQSRTFSVKVALKEHSSQPVQLGQSARVFFTEVDKNVLSVPLASVSATDNQAYVWVVQKDQRVKKVTVTLGRYGRDSVPVLSGLNGQDYVVVGGVHLLREKQKIKPIDRENRSVDIGKGAG